MLIHHQSVTASQRSPSGWRRCIASLDASSSRHVLRECHRPHSRLASDLQQPTPVFARSGRRTPTFPLGGAGRAMRARRQRYGLALGSGRGCAQWNIASESGKCARGLQVLANALDAPSHS